MSFDELYDGMLHNEFRSGPEAASAPHARHAASRNPSRSRTVALVASGGAACAVVGALLGGLGSEFGVTPATAHSLNSSSQFVPLSTLASTAFRVPTVAALASLAKPAAKSSTVTLTSGGGNGVTTIPTSLSGEVQSVGTVTTASPVTPITGTGGSGLPAGGGSNGSAGGTTAPTNSTPTQVLTTGLTGVLSNLTLALGGLVGVPSNPSAGLTPVINPLASALADLSNTLTGLIAVLPVPVATPGLPVIATAAHAPAVTTGSPSVYAPGAPAAGATKGVSALAGPLLNSVTAPASSVVAPVVSALGSAGNGLPSLPTVPLPSLGGAPVPSLPVSTAPVAGAPAPTLPTVDLPVIPASTTTPTCVSTPSVAVPTPTIGTKVNLGGVSVGVQIGGTTTATVCAS
ncbi:MAG TPA: hypothetical protein VNG12_03910 [Acidimicrobiales bacterium]|nr:hypothetical protein [Acidimicrobiales bacterium]